MGASTREKLEDTIISIVESLYGKALGIFNSKINMEEFFDLRNHANSFLAMKEIEDSGLSKRAITKLESIEDEFNRILIEFANNQS